MKIFILESLKQDDPKTGKLIHNYLDSKGAQNEYHIFKSKSELLDICEIVKIGSAAEKYKPFIHFYCHGNEDGIGAIKSDESVELITWGEISQAFRDIYLACKQKSVICMSSCHGFNVIKLVSRCEPCPYENVCGSFEKISFSDSYNAYTKFYDLILSGKSIHDSALEIHEDPTFPNLKFIGLDSKTLFNLTIDGYLKKECTQAKLIEKKEYCGKIIERRGPLNKYQIEYLNYTFSLEGQKQILQNCAKIFFSLK